MQKRVTLLNADGNILFSMEDTNAFEPDLKVIWSRNPTCTIITYDAKYGDSGWCEIATTHKGRS